VSFSELKLDELKQAADYYGVELPKKFGISKKEVAEELQLNGVSYEDWAKVKKSYEEQSAEVEHAPAAEPGEPEPEKVLLKMERLNPTFEERGYRFTQVHPFVLVDEETADFLMETYEGFRIASPRELREYYKK
jgi:hypothetical protein